MADFRIKSTASQRQQMLEEISARTILGGTLFDLLAPRQTDLPTPVGLVPTASSGLGSLVSKVRRLKAKSPKTVTVYRGARPGEAGRWFTEDPAYARWYVGPESGRQLLKRKIRPKNPLNLDKPNDAKIVAGALERATGTKVSSTQLQQGIGYVPEATAKELTQKGYDFITIKGNVGEPTGRLWISLRGLRSKVAGQ